MRKIFPLMLVIGLLFAACSGVGMPAPTATPVPSPVRVPTMTPPSLIREIKLETQTGTAYTLAWSPDGETLAVASGGEITLLSADLKETLTIFKPVGGALGVTWNPDATQFATVNGFRSPTINIWDLDPSNAELTPAQEIQSDADQYGVSWSRDGKSLATLAGDSQSVIQIWDTDKWQKVHTFDPPYIKPRRALYWSAGSSTVYGAGESSGQMIVFALNVTDGSVQELGKFRLAEAEAFAISPDARRIAIADPRGVVQIYDVTSGNVLTGIKSVDQPVDIAWNPNGTTLAILDYKTTLQLWDVSQ
jgi:WD40 repeat protein